MGQPAPGGGERGGLRKYVMITMMAAQSVNMNECYRILSDCFGFGLPGCSQLAFRVNGYRHYHHRHSHLLMQ